MMMLNTYYTYSEDEGLQYSAPAQEGYPVEIVKQEDGSLAIENFINGSDELITINVDFANGTFTIPVGQVAYVHSTAGDCVLTNFQSEGDLTGTINGEILIINEIYGVVVAEGQYKDYLLTDYTTSALVKPNGKMAWTNSSSENKDVDVFLLQDEEEHVVTVFNFAEWGTAIDIQLQDEQKFVIEPQLVGSSSTGGDYYTSSAIAGTNYIGSEEITGTGTANTLTSSSNFTAVSDKNYWYGNQGAFTITANGLEFVYPVIEDVAAIPANPAIVNLSEYNAENGYGAVIFDVPATDVDGNDLKTSKLFYQLYSDIDGVTAPIVFTSDLYENIEEDMTEVPYSFIDDYDFDTYNGHKRVWLNYDYTNYTRIGIKSIYKGGDVVNETEIQWLDIAALRELQAALSELANEIEAAEALQSTPGWTEGQDDLAEAIDAAIEAYLDDDATVASIQEALEALQKAEQAFEAANALHGTASWVAKAQGYTNALELTDFDIDEFIKGTFAAGTYTSSSKYYTSGSHVRFYAGNTLTIAGDAKYVSKITKIQLTFTTAQYNKSISTDNGTYTKGSTTGLWEGEATSVTFTNDDSAQARITQIDVMYEKTDEALGVKTVETVTIPVVGGIYNMQGQRLNEKPAKGLYIMSGKKFVVK